MKIIADNGRDRSFFRQTRPAAQLDVRTNEDFARALLDLRIRDNRKMFAACSSSKRQNNVLEMRKSGFPSISFSLSDKVEAVQALINKYDQSADLACRRVSCQNKRIDG
jgi:hypothetical protein